MITEEDDYQRVLKLAGAEIIAFDSFGSYQGDWWCLCKYDNQVGWATGEYGSCSGCDAFLIEFGYKYDEQNDLEKVKEFGKRYLEDSLLSQDDALKEASRNLEWDHVAKDMVKFIEDSWKKYKDNE